MAPVLICCALTLMYTQAGLDGSGQIIGSGDSGINMRSCYFKDDSVSFGKTGTRRGFSVGSTRFDKGVTAVVYS
jgi:hypothetical protein